jgi:hypothetical protein
VIPGWSYRFAHATIAGVTANVTPYVVCAGK